MSGVSSLPSTPLRSRLLDLRSDRFFVLGSAWLVPVPILTFVLLRTAGMPAGAAADLVTLVVMVPLGGPHVVATFGRTLFDPAFWQRDRWLALASVLVLCVVAATAIASAFFDIRVAGAPPMAFLLTAFFFWAGLHVVQQHCYAASLLVDRIPGVERDRLGAIDHVLMLLALYPASLFRMSMTDLGAAPRIAADPDALATRIVYFLGGSASFADDYVFRIGRAAPILPDFLLQPAWWLTVSGAYVIALSMFVAKSWRRHCHGLPFGLRGRLVLTMALVGAVVPLVPDLDSGLQGINAWHSCQYLGIAMLLHRQAVARGDIRSPWLVRLAAPGNAWRAYRIGFFATLVLVAAIVGGAFVLQSASDGAFVLFGHDEPPTDTATGQPLYRPGSLLLTYYLVGFGFLLVHYLQDTVQFLRPRKP